MAGESKNGRAVREDKEENEDINRPKRMADKKQVVRFYVTFTNTPMLQIIRLYG